MNIRTAAIALLIAVLLPAFGVTSVSPAQADTPGCVTQREFRQADRGTRIQRVHRVFDTRGWFINGGAGGFVRGYQFCPRAQKAAGVRNFKIIYKTNIEDSKLIWTRVWHKYCGATYATRRPCF